MTMTKKFIMLIKLLVIIKKFSLKNTFKVALQYLFKFFILINTVFNFKLNFRLKIDPKMCTFKNLEEILKTWKNFVIKSGNPVLVWRQKFLKLS